jgi:hypothetical protein
LGTDSAVPAGLEQVTAGTATLADGPQATEEEAARWADLERRVAQSTTLRRPASFQWVVPAVMAVLAGITLHRDVPHPPAAVAAVAVLLVLLLAVQPEAQRIRASTGPEPDVKELDEYVEWLPRRIPAVPAATLTAARRHLAALAGGRWRSAHLLIARRENAHRPVAQRFQPGDRIELILDDHIAEGPAEVAAGALAHEARHCDRLPLAASSLSGLLCQPGAVLVAAWALPWPATLTLDAAGQAIAVLAVLRVTATLLFWGVEIYCDLGAAADQGAAAQCAVFDVLAAEDARMTRSFARRAVARLLNWGAPPPHPPLELRRAAVRLRYGRLAEPESERKPSQR